MKWAWSSQAMAAGLGRGSESQMPPSGRVERGLTSRSHSTRCDCSAVLATEQQRGT